jgi:hypothetical protein
LCPLGFRHCLWSCLEAHLSLVVRVWESAALNGAHWNHA